MKNSSVSIAKSRLKSLLVSDRVNCTPDTFDKIQSELYKTISKYIEIIPEEFDVQVTRSHIYIKLTGEDL
ncbi:MAG: cell division topological specificity factor MinE [Tyzzerella sp.]|nr:cell division topological specificity factor MinE [Tyzzerella sp.]